MKIKLFALERLENTISLWVKQLKRRQKLKSRRILQGFINTCFIKTNKSKQNKNKNWKLEIMENRLWEWVIQEKLRRNSRIGKCMLKERTWHTDWQINVLY